MILQAEMTLTIIASCFILAIELLFYLVFHNLLVPRANRRTEPHAYRDYPIGERRKLLQRILARIRHTCKATKRTDQEYKEVVQEFILQWFQKQEVTSEQPCRRNELNEKSSKAAKNGPVQPTKSKATVLLSIPRLTRSNTSLLDSSSIDSNVAIDEQDSGSDRSNYCDDYVISLSEPVNNCWTIRGLSKLDMDLFFAWAFFGREPDCLSRAETTELEAFYTIIEDECLGLSFDDGLSNDSQACFYKPRRLSLESLSPIHRPLFVYMAVWLIKTILCNLILIILGFRLIQSHSNLVAWHRPARANTGDSHAATLLPVLFFHGIAPAGLCFYIPMILHMIRDGRAAYLFESPPISYCSLGFNALTEMETVHGVEEILSRTGHGAASLSLIGHSFGSCQLTWLIKSKLQDRILQIALLDPVTILLSEPDVMNNFLYAKTLSRIRLVAASELLTEHYLRRHFSWYNSELWLNDLPNHIHVLVALSEHDEIINATKVKQQLDICNDERRDKHPHQVIYWEHVGHAHCVTSRSKWIEIKQRMLEQELLLTQQQRCPQTSIL
ncbi:hypothetical protein MPSEU_000604300 [Mayamaea pseudoterrestris]|nr:hypothetical protein MPSEU_000604300 [Mayamaea pseudoterrestris]